MPLFIMKHVFKATVNSSEVSDLFKSQIYMPENRDFIMEVALYMKI